MKRLVGMGVDGIFTNRPAVLKKVLEDSWSKMKP
jgi:glycerophosphoryl diester phosphodiesterase